jgi:hypothetical protein
MSNEEKPPIPHEVFVEMITKLRAKFQKDLSTACEAAVAVRADDEMMKSVGMAYLYAMIEMIGQVSEGLEVPFVRMIEMIACGMANNRDLNPNEEKIHDFLHQLAKAPMDGPGEINVGVLHGEQAKRMIDHVRSGGKHPLDELLEQHGIGKPKNDEKPN